MSDIAAEEQVDYEDAGAGSDNDDDNDDQQQSEESGSQNDNNEHNDHEDDGNQHQNRRSSRADNENGGGKSRRSYRDRQHDNEHDTHELSAEDISNIRDRRRLGNSQGIVEHVLFISRFAATTTKGEIRDLFSPYGPLGDINIMVNIAFIDFANAEDASRAKHALHHQPGLGADSLIVDFKKLPGTSGGSGGGRGGDRSSGYGSRGGYQQSDYRGSGGGGYDNHYASGGGGRSGGRDTADAYESSRRPAVAAYNSGGSGGGYNRDEYYSRGSSSGGSARDEYRSSAPAPYREVYRDEYAPPVQQRAALPIRSRDDPPYHSDPYQRAPVAVARGEPRYADPRDRDYLPPSVAGYRGAPAPSQSHDLRDEVRRYISTGGGGNSRSRSRSRERVVDSRRGYPPMAAFAPVSAYDRDGGQYRGGSGSGRDSMYPPVDYGYNSGGGRPISRGGMQPAYDAPAAAVSGYAVVRRDSRDREYHGGSGARMISGSGGRGGRGGGLIRSSRPLPVIAVSASGAEIAAFPNPHYPPKHAHHQINSLKREREESAAAAAGAAQQEK